MKIYKALIVIASLMLMVACGGGNSEDPSLKELTFEKLAGEWSLPDSDGIVIDGVDRTLNYRGFSLSFTDGGYNTTNAGDLFKASGTWEWTDDSATQIILDDGKTVTINSLTTSLFVFSFTRLDGPVRAGLSGSYIITVER